MYATHGHRFAMASADVTGASSMNRAALAVHALRILCVCRGLARPMRVADNPAKIKPVVSRDLAPAFSGLVCRNDVIETLARLIREQMRFLQFAPAQPMFAQLGAYRRIRRFRSRFSLRPLRWK